MNSFIWGVSSSAAQTEGACFEDGKSASIWDEFAKKSRNIGDKSTLDPGTLFYYKFKEDIDILARLKIPNFRFSLSWPRIIPGGTGEVNSKGIDFYNKVIDTCIENNITPWLTLYHWDLPQILEERGGWTNRDIVEWFGEYVHKCSLYFGDRVKNWMLVNEPMAFCGAGYFLGVHAPGKRGRKYFVAAAHHTVLAISKGYHIIKNNIPDSFVGSTFSMSEFTPATTSEKDIKAAGRATDLLNNFFIHPVLGKGYPLQRLKFLNLIEKYMKQGDELKMKTNLDFLGIQTYTREVIKHSMITPFIKATVVSARKRKVNHTEMGWEIHPSSIYSTLKNISDINNQIPLIVTENGAAFADVVNTNNSVVDNNRIDYLKSHINNVLLAKNEGVNVNGYFAWSLTDNFEWAEGYRPRFGLVYIDYENNLKRIIKKSGFWYSQKISEKI